MSLPGEQAQAASGRACGEPASRGPEGGEGVGGDRCERPPSGGQAASLAVSDRADGRPAMAATRDWSRLIAVHQHRVVLSLVAAGSGFDQARELANEAWARLMEKDRRGALAEVKLPGLAIVQARFLALDERR